MKTKYIALALTMGVGVLNLVSAQETAVKEAPAKEAAKKEMAAPTFEAKTPLEKQALKVMKIVMTFPDVLGSIKDDASADTAKTKLDEMISKLEVQAEELKKLPVPSNDERKALAEKMKPLQSSMEQKMQSAMMGMMQLSPDLGPKVQGIMMSVGPKMQSVGQTMEKYFEPDKEKPAPTPAKEEKK